MANFGPLTAEIGSGVWGTPTNFNGFCILAVLLHGTLVVGISQTLWRWTEGVITLGTGPHSSRVTCVIMQSVIFMYCSTGNVCTDVLQIWLCSSFSDVSCVFTDCILLCMLHSRYIVSCFTSILNFSYNIEYVIVGDSFHRKGTNVKVWIVTL